MPRSAPVRNARFNLAPTHQGLGHHVFDGVIIQNTFTQTGLQPAERAGQVIEYRSAGMWFKDIATLFGFSTASQASAFYVRECRLRNISPIVRERAVRSGREILDDEAMDNLPAFLNRDNFQGEREFTFGVEIETVGIRLAQAEAAVMGLSIACQNNGYTHGNTHTWKCVPDGSLRGRDGTAEIVSRVLSGASGLQEMRRVMKALKSAGAKTNRSTGMHVHIGVEHLGDRHLAMIIRLHCIFQQVFNGFITERRRESSFAKPRPLSDALRLARNWANGSRDAGYGNRYHSLNLHSYEKYGTFEMRSYDGCLNPRRASAWLQLHMDFFQFCAQVADNTMGNMNERIYATDTIQMLDEKTATVIFQEPTAPVFDGEASRLIAKEWLEGENTFITNPAVREVLKQEWNRLNPTEQI